MWEQNWVVQGGFCWSSPRRRALGCEFVKPLRRYDCVSRLRHVFAGGVLVVVTRRFNAATLACMFLNEG